MAKASKPARKSAAKATYTDESNIHSASHLLVVRWTFQGYDYVHAIPPPVSVANPS
jgi:hypothetical protein